MAAQNMAFPCIHYAFTFQRVPPGYGRPPVSNEEGGVSTSKATFPIRNCNPLASAF